MKPNAADPTAVYVRIIIAVILVASLAFATSANPGPITEEWATGALQALGVRTLRTPGEAPLTAVPFRVGKTQRAFVLPDADWTGLTRVGGQEVRVLGEGSWVRVR